MTCSVPECTSERVGPYAKYCEQHGAGRRRKPLVYQPSPEADRLIEEAYRKSRIFGNRKSLILAAKKLGWPKWRVNRRGCELGLARTKESPWSEAELDILERWNWMCDESLSRKLSAAGFTRTRTAVHLKIKRMRIRQSRDWYSATALALAFGVDQHKVTRWIAAGLLKAERRGTERTEAQGGDSWLITHPEASRFALACPDEYDLAKVEKFWFLDLITGGKICK